MWFRNRIVNPVVRLLLRSPLHPVLSRPLVILSYQGRKTGRWRSLPCMYARDGQDLTSSRARPAARSGGATCSTPLESGWTPTAPPLVVVSIHLDRR
jgi:hypothetical protein